MGETIVTVSRYTYSETIARLENTIAEAGGTVFAKIDQSGTAAGVGLSLRPTTLLIFGNPKAGTPLMAAFPLIGLDLPLKIQVWDENGTVNVAYVPAHVIAKRYDVGGNDALITAIDRQLEGLVHSIA